MTEEFFEDECFQSVALAPIDGDDDETNVDTGLTSASSYLRSVMNEAKNLPEVAIAVPTAFKPSNGFKKQLGPTMRVFAQAMKYPDATLNDESINFSQTTAANVPSEDWQVEQLEQFIMLHHYIEVTKANIKENNERGPNIPSANNEFIWCCELYGKEFACSVIDIDAIPRTFRKRPWYTKLKEDCAAKKSQNA